MKTVKGRIYCEIFSKHLISFKGTHWKINCGFLKSDILNFHARSDVNVDSDILLFISVVFFKLFNFEGTSITNSVKLYSVPGASGKTLSKTFKMHKLRYF